MGSQQLGNANKYVVQHLILICRLPQLAYATSGHAWVVGYSRTVKAARKAYTQKLLN